MEAGMKVGTKVGMKKGMKASMNLVICCRVQILICMHNIHKTNNCAERRFMGEKPSNQSEGRRPH